MAFPHDVDRAFIDKGRAPHPPRCGAHVRCALIGSVNLALLLLPACSSVNTTRPTGTAPVDIYYATTRDVDVAAKDLAKAFGKKPADGYVCRYGEATVSIGLPHDEGDQKHAVITTVRPMLAAKGLTEDDFRARVAGQLSHSGRHVIVYVHGYNNSFDVAARRAAVFAHDLKPQVAPKPAIFSWPSYERFTAYVGDEDRALLNQEQARKFIEMFRASGSPARVVLIGHSLGARVLTYALRDLYLMYEGRGSAPPVMFDHLVLLEPDVNREYFNVNVDRIRALCGSVTVYASNKDRPIQASRIVHKAPRVGDLKGRVRLAGVDVIDASRARIDFLGHSYDGPALLEDLRAILRGKKVEDRIGKTLDKNAKGEISLKPSPVASTIATRD
jgi:esterase/lipase superfamily enzyme